MFKSTPRLFARRVEAIPHEQEKQTARIWTTWTTEHRHARRVEKKRPPPRCSFAACAAFALSFDVSQARPLFVQQKTKAATRPAEGCSVHTARPNIDNVDNMDTTARRVETTQARGGEYRKSKRPPPTNRERPKPQIKNERPKEQRARLCTNIQHEAKRNNRPAWRLYGASRQEAKRYAPDYSPAPVSSNRAFNSISNDLPQCGHLATAAGGCSNSSDIWTPKAAAIFSSVEMRKSLFIDFDKATGVIPSRTAISFCVIPCPLQRRFILNTDMPQRYRN